MNWQVMTLVNCKRYKIIMDKPNLFMEILFKKKHYVNFEIKAVKNPTTEEGEKKNW